jgi:hypothetical protein
MLAAAAAVVSLAWAAPGARLHPERITLRGAIIHGVDTPIQVSAAGPISGHGTAQDKDNPNGKSGVLTLDLPKGSVFITNQTTSLATKVDRRRCRATITERGTFKMVGGTRFFAHASGNGTYTNVRKLIGGRTHSGQCAGRNAPPQAVYEKVVLTGKAEIRGR